MFYSLLESNRGLCVRRLWARRIQTVSLRKIRRALQLKEGLFTDELHELLVNAPYGGELRIYFNAIFSRLITGDTSHDFKRIRFYGGVIVAIVDSRNGAGYHVSLQTDITLPFYRGKSFCGFSGTLFLCE